MTQHTSDLEREWRSEVTAAPAQLSAHARILIEPDRASTTFAENAAVIARDYEQLRPGNAELLQRWLTDDAPAIVAAASLAGDGARVILDEKLTRLELLVELLRAQDRRLETAERDVELLAELVRAQGDDAETLTDVDLTAPPGPLLAGQ